MELHVANSTPLDYHNWQNGGGLERAYQIEESVTSILFDKSHNELSQSESAVSDEVISRSLSTILEENLSCEVAYHNKKDGSLTTGVLAKHSVLVLASPTDPFEIDEIEAITEFVLEGNSLLISCDDVSFREQRRCGSSVNLLLKTFRLQFKQVLSNLPDEISNLSPHGSTGSVMLM